MTRLRSHPVPAALLAAGVLALAPAAWAYFTASGAGTGSAVLATLDPPSAVSASASAGAVALSWTGVTAPGGGPVDGYHVQRSAGTAGGTCASSPSDLLPATSTGCSDTDVAPGTYAYTVVAVYRSWTAGAAGAPVTAAPSALARFEVTAPAAATAGAAFTVTVTAKDDQGGTMTTYDGAKALVWSGAAAAPNGSTPTYPPPVVFTGGVGTTSVTLVKAQAVSLTAADGTATGTSGTIAVSPGDATRFAVGAAGTQVAGSAFAVTVGAEDAFGNTATGYTGAMTVAWSGPGVAPSGTPPFYPVSVSFVDGAGTATVTLYRAETTTLAASEASVTGTSGGIVVQAGPASTMRLANWVVNGSPASACVTGPFEVGGANGYLSASIDIFDAWRNVPAPTPVTINLHSSDSAKFTATTSVSVTGAGSPVNRSSALTVTHTANGSDNTTITASAAGFTNLVFTVKK